MSLTIDSCQICRQRAELMLYKPDGRMVCGECRMVMDAGAVLHVGENQTGQPEFYGRSVVSNLQPGMTEEEMERQKYIGVIASKANDAWITRLIKEVISKRILKYDWQRVIANPRWFSVLDLRRFALDLDPNFEKRYEEFDEPQGLVDIDDEQPAGAEQ